MWKLGTLFWKREGPPRMQLQGAYLIPQERKESVGLVFAKVYKSKEGRYWVHFARWAAQRPARVECDNIKAAKRVAKRAFKLCPIQWTIDEVRQALESSQ